MKGAVILISIVFSVIVSSCLFYLKHHDKSVEIDLHKEAFNHFNDVLSRGSIMNCIILPHDQPVYAQVKYAFAPVTLYLHRSGKHLDTVMYVCRQQATDSLITDNLKGKTIISDYKNQDFKYIMCTYE